MNIIPTADQQILVFNVFTVRPENQQAFIDCIKGANETADLPGLLSQHLLRSLDGTQVINHMHWASREAFDQATAGNSVIAATKAQVHQLIEGRGPNRYEVLQVSSSLATPTSGT